MGVIAVNFASPSLGGLQHDTGFAPDTWIFRAVEEMAHRKAYPMFCFLFGLGFFIQSERTSAGFTATYLRRLLVLFLIGAAHKLLIWHGDILNTYAVLGLLLLATRAWSSRAVLAASAILAALPAMFGLMEVQTTHADLSMIYGPQAARLYTEEPYLKQVRVRWEAWVASEKDIKVHVSDLGWFGLFLAGSYAGRRRWFREPKRYLATFRRILWASLGVFFLGRGWTFALAHAAGFAAVHSPWALAVLHTLQGPIPTSLAKLYYQPALAASYTCFIVILLQKPRVKRLCAPVASFGRMALTNYLAHSTIGALLFYGIGLKLYGKLGYAAGESIAAAVCLAGIVASHAWLQRFRYGPAEWLWRSLTYGRAMPLHSAA